MHAGHQGGSRLMLSVQIGVTLKVGLQFPGLLWNLLFASFHAFSNGSKQSVYAVP